MLGGERTGGAERASGAFLGTPEQERDCDSTRALRVSLRKLSAQGRTCVTEEGPMYGVKVLWGSEQPGTESRALAREGTGATGRRLT